jgi:ATP-dependent Clp protease ATP-binding subunit ClpB
MDEGHLTDSRGTKVDFRSSLLVLTSNLGAKPLAELAEGRPSEEAQAEQIEPHHPGPITSLSSPGPRSCYTWQARSEVMKAVAEALPPEFVNRLDQIVLFNRLPRDQIRQIASIEVKKVRERMADRKLHLHVSDTAVEWLAEAGYDPQYGARPVRRAVRQHLLNPLARALIGHEEGNDEGVHVLVDTQQAPSAPSGGGGSSVLSSIGFGGGGGATELQSERTSLRIRLVGEGGLDEAKGSEEQRWHS